MTWTITNKTDADITLTLDDATTETVKPSATVTVDCGVARVKAGEKDYTRCGTIWPFLEDEALNAFTADTPNFYIKNPKTAVECVFTPA